MFISAIVHTLFSGEFPFYMKSKVFGPWPLQYKKLDYILFYDFVIVQ